MASIVRQKNVKVKVPRECFLCKGKFEAGTEMVCNVMYQNDALRNVYFCKECQEKLDKQKAQYVKKDMFAKK